VAHPKLKIASAQSAQTIHEHVVHNMRKTILLIFGVIFLQFIFSCETQYSASELNNNFSKEQISDLNKITEFFKENVCTNINSDFKTCYRETNHDSLIDSGYGMDLKINFDKQKELYKQISKSTFNEIWRFSEYTNLSGTKAKSIDLVSTGRYQKYLKDIGKTNKIIAKYAYKIEAVGTFMPQDIVYWEVLHDQKHFNLDDPNIQLILAIDYLTKNDILFRNPDLFERTEPKFK